ncbi:uncharacterized protein LAJ45_06220 [Morchella importuna]|uniref:Ribonuclease H-like protein n=1 Tax=Morchella conica CCBAS932 TaxID=1392247 RepID=A0A3N4L826_9PEZI|nr:uncharacterized protein LAJ45_06220 [Morchella importuna]KAH8149590.1 hypothetical protein LAJ45_06220 [Morchella importuna]RPB17642.1 ribonuclease H-like protein [Morchella conica CCBAS932]
MLNRSTTPIVWIDCEMTGLDYENDVILQICCYITDFELNILDNGGFETVIHYEKPVLDKMGEWCQRTHASTGLTNRVLNSTTTIEAATSQLLAYIQKYVPTPKVAVLAGNSIHADRAFLNRQFPSIIDHLHYRLLDVSTVKEAVRMWCSDETLRNVPPKKETHEARMDILESIGEMKHYKKVLFDGK